MALVRRGLSSTGLSSVLLSGLFVTALVAGVGYNALAASQTSLLDYYGASVPSVTRAVSATPGSLQATVRWVKPVTDGGAPIIGYDVTPYVGLFALAVRHFNSPATTEVVTGLANAKVTYFKVAARNPIGLGPKSGASISILIGAPTAPKTPVALSANGAGTFKWVVPDSDNGQAINGYVVTPILAGQGQRPRVFNSTGTTRLLTGLTNGRSYAFKVAARNSIGLGPVSLISNAVVIGAPAAPKGVHPVKVAPTTFKVNFSPGPNNGAPVRRYAAICASSNGGATKGQYGLSSPVTVTGLTVGKTYTCTVRAANKRGNGLTSLASPPVST
jgi:titin